MDLRILTRFARMGAAAILSPRYRTAWVCSGNSLLEVLARNLTLFQEGSHPCSKFQKDFKRDWCDLRAVSGEIRESYRFLWNELDAEGFELLSRPPNTYKVSEDVLLDPRSNGSRSTYLIGVYLRGRSGPRFLVGVFDDVWAARTWVAQTYPEDLPIYEPVYYEDELTKAILEILGRAPSLGGME